MAKATQDCELFRGTETSIRNRERNRWSENRQLAGLRNLAPCNPVLDDARASEDISLIGFWRMHLASPCNWNSIVL